MAPKFGRAALFLTNICWDRRDTFNTFLKQTCCLKIQPSTTMSCIVTGCHSTTSSKTQLTEPPVNISQSCIFRQTTMAPDCCQKPNRTPVTIKMFELLFRLQKKKKLNFNHAMDKFKIISDPLFFKDFVF